MQWLKDVNNKWSIATNDIKYTDFKENLKSTADLNIVVSDTKKAVIYIPTHNIHDVYEWFRIFKDSYINSNEFDKYGFAIHGYFDKKRGESIKGWFPNLIEVKASSSDTYKYYNGVYGKHRSSVDYIENFTNISELFIDGVQIFNEELVLLKNQKYENAGVFLITLGIGTKYQVSIGIGDEQYFNVGDRCFITDAAGLYHDGIILSITFPSYGTMEITTDITVTNPQMVGDYDSGPWYLNSSENKNGVYQFFENQLIPISEMYDKYKTYGQIVYTYQGLTNENKEFYLRRIEDLFAPSYGQYPTYNSVWPLVYSEGDAYLVKCEIDYNLDPLTPIYPSTNPPYNAVENIYRLLFLDNTMSDKILSTSSAGIGTYKTIEIPTLNDADINMNIPYVSTLPGYGINDITFNTYDVNSITNVLDTYNRDKYYGSPVPPSYNFRHVQAPKNKVYNRKFNTSTNNINITQSINTTVISVSYNFDTQKLVFGSLQPGDFFNMMFEIYDSVTSQYITTLDEQFVVVSATTDNTNAIVEFYPPLDINFIHEFETYKTMPNSTSIVIDEINQFGAQNISYTPNSNIDISLLVKALNKCIIGKLYDISYIFKTGQNEAFLKLNAIRQNHNYKWENYGVLINTETNPADPIPMGAVYAIDHVVELNRRKYLKGYTNISDFITNYLDCSPVTSIDLAQMKDIPCVYKNAVNASDRFGVEGSNKEPGKGNIILFGPDYKEVFLDNVKKDTVIVINPAVSVPSMVWVSNIEWDDDMQLGTVTTLNYITSPYTTEPVTISTVRDISTISAWLYDIFNKQVNDFIDHDTLLPYDWTAYKPDTASYAYAMLNYCYDNATSNKNNKLLANLTGIVYKEFNEPKISFLKRDKKFLFSDNITNVDAASIADVDIINAPATIDGVTLAVGNLVLLKDQVNPVFNRIYVFDGAGNPLILYGSIFQNAYWYVTGGATNIYKTYQSQFVLPLNSSTSITFVPIELSSKKDSRLTMKPVEIAKLGVDNKTQPWKKINVKYDSIETSENLLNIQIGINNRRRIRFIDGLTEYKIINNIDGQGQYAWILDEDVIVDDAIVGCTQDTGPGTGTLIWYTGVWEAGVWVDGIWIQGQWNSGTWLNGTFNAFAIQDYYYYVTYSTTHSDILSIWKQGIWTQGVWNGGIAEDMTWLDGTFNGGLIKECIWSKGTFTNGVINHIEWYDGTFNGGDFETGIWFKGILMQLDPTKPARFGTKSNGNSNEFRDKAIWYSGIFDGGEFWSGINIVANVNIPSVNHQGSIWYSGEFRSGNFWGGTFITGVFKNSTWHDGVWFGGYYVSSITDLTGNDKRLQIAPEQYDAIIGLADDLGYIQNMEHRLHTYYQTEFQLIATPTASDAFSLEAFINYNDTDLPFVPYIDKPYVVGSGTDTTIDLTISANTAALTTYEAPNPSTHTPDGNPFVCAVFKNATWKRGVWLNGYFASSIWEQGAWINGYLTDSVFGINNF